MTVAPEGSGQATQDAQANSDGPAPHVLPIATAHSAAAPSVKSSLKKRFGKRGHSVPPASNEIQTGQEEGAAAMGIAPLTGAGAARALRKQRARRVATWLALCVGVPFVLSVIYYGFIAREEFESTAQIAVRGHDVGPRVAMLRERITSRDMLAKVEERAHFSAHYEKHKELFAGGKRDHELFRRHVKVDGDPQTGLVTISVRAFSSKAAQQFARIMVEESRAFIRELSAPANTGVLNAAKVRLQEVEQRLVEFEQSVADGTQTDAAAVITVRRELLNKELESALRGVDDATRAEHAAPDGSVVVVASPTLSSVAAYPRRVTSVITVLFVSLLLFGIGALLIAAVREHAQF